MSTQTMVDAIDAAILAILTGAQEYRLPTGAMVRRADLGALQKLRETYSAQLNSETAGSVTCVEWADR